MCRRKHTGRRDIGASQREGDRPALRAAAPTQRGLSSHSNPPLVPRRGKECLPKQGTPMKGMPPIACTATVKMYPGRHKRKKWSTLLCSQYNEKTLVVKEEKTIFSFRWAKGENSPVGGTQARDPTAKPHVRRRSPTHLRHQGH